MKTTKVDFTKMRLGTVTRRWEYRNKDGSNASAERKVCKCPKCGRKGEKVQYRKNVKPHDMYIHIAEISEVIPGFPLSTVRDQCTVSIEEQPCSESESSSNKLASVQV